MIFMPLARWTIWSCCGFSLKDAIRSQIDVRVDAPNLIYRLTFFNAASALIHNMPHLLQSSKGAAKTQVEKIGVKYIEIH